jgi:hypothetical protein
MGDLWWPRHRTSRAPEGFQRAAFRDISIGDVVWYEALHQSRTGMIHRAPVEGRIIAIWPTVSRLLRSTSAVTLELEVEGGPQQRVLMGRRDVVYVKLVPANEGAGEDAGTERQDLPNPILPISERASQADESLN